MVSRLQKALRLGAIATPPLAALGLVGVLLVVATWTGLVTDLAGQSPLDAFRTLFGEYAFWVIGVFFLLLLGAVAGHQAAVGPKTFSHAGEGFLVFSVAARINHWIAAVSCTLLILTGLIMLAGAAPGPRGLLEGTGVVRLTWGIHRVTAVVFVLTAVFMLAKWAMGMLPRKHDLGWLKIAGGYLSKEKRPVPAHMFNAGQKMWFWVATIGGLVMGTTGLLMHLFVGGRALLNLVALFHHLVAAAIIVMYCVHLYMVLFAVKGSLPSMIHGKKSEEEVSILHALYYEELQKERAPSDGEVPPEGDGKPPPSE